MPTRNLVACCLVLLVTTGCASTGVEMKPAHPYGADLNGESYSWHQVRFKWRWPPEEEPQWPLDLLAAHGIVSALITEYREALPLWRFHRRAGRDAAGHQLSFLFYTSDTVAGRIDEAMREHALTRRLLEAGLLEKIYVTEPDQADRVRGTSDPAWPEALQSTWPMFIMGVSQTWLALIEINAGKPPPPDANLEREATRYARVDEEVGAIWGEYAQHAFFHHLSGVFGYQPMVLRKRMRF